MSTPQLERLREHCHQLRLYQVENELTARLGQAAKKEISYAEFLDELLALEVGSKVQKHHQMRIAMARLPFQKTLESVDFKFQPSIDPKQIRELTTGRYMESGDNVLFLGPPGVGKSHLAVALGMKAWLLYGATRGRPPRAPPTALNPVGEFQMINAGDFRMIDTFDGGSFRGAHRPVPADH